MEDIDFGVEALIFPANVVKTIQKGQRSVGGIEINLRNHLFWE
ncbi:hypothetical protein [Alistipes sp.]